MAINMYKHRLLISCTDILAGPLFPISGFFIEQLTIFPMGHSLSFGSEEDTILVKM